MKLDESDCGWLLKQTPLNFMIDLVIFRAWWEWTAALDSSSKGMHQLNLEEHGYHSY